ncbi:hypothetical protein N7454_004093 [Penicillium verhagenii]|nr:hypothetical protein N7454_004093 [Penicillium verhagenii]
MHFTTTLVSAAILAVAHAGLPIASLEFQSWETCDVGVPVHGEPKFKASVTATTVTCDKTTVNRDWSIDNFAFKAYIDTKDALFCNGVHVWNNDNCAGDSDYFMPFDHQPVVQGVCLPDFLDPGFVSFQLDCDFPGGGVGAIGEAAGQSNGPESGSDSDSDSDDI